MAVSGAAYEIGHLSPAFHHLLLSSSRHPLTRKHTASWAADRLAQIPLPLTLTLFTSPPGTHLKLALQVKQLLQPRRGLGALGPAAAASALMALRGRGG